MAGYTLINVRGVLADYHDAESPAAAKLVPAGYNLYHGMKQISKISLIIDDPAHLDRLSYWLRTHGFTDHIHIHVNSRADSPLEGRSDLILAARQMGPVDLVVEADPALAARMLHAGVPTLLLSVPQYTRPEFRPGASRVGKPWDALVSELDAQRELSTGDDRVTADVAGTRFEDG